MKKKISTKKKFVTQIFSKEIFCFEKFLANQFKLNQFPCHEVEAFQIGNDDDEGSLQWEQIKPWKWDQVSISSTFLRTNFSYERHFGSFFLTCFGFEKTFVQKMRAYNVDEIDTRGRFHQTYIAKQKFARAQR